jgi:hypothetical protein
MVLDEAGGVVSPVKYQPGPQQVLCRITSFFPSIFDIRRLLQTQLIHCHSQIRDSETSSE